jgi:hypothetical protein
MKRKLLLFSFLLSTSLIFSQKNVLSISGKILDGEQHDPMEFVNIQLYSLPDSTYIMGSISGKDGDFKITADIKPGKYYIRVSFIGYETITKDIDLTNTSSHLNLGRISLNVNAIFLEGARVYAEVIPVIVTEDTTIYSAEAFSVPEGAMLEELVKKLPGVEISEDGKITVNGKEIKKIMVDGKEFFTEDPQVALKNLPANMVESVKSYDRKSDNARLTGIDDDEDEAVLDLSVKKGMKKGWFGNVLAGGGNKSRYEAGGMVNRFQDNSNLSVIASMNNTNNQGFSEFGDSGFGVKGNAGSGITSSKIIGATFAQELNKMELGGSVQYGYSDNDARRKRATETFLESGSIYGADTTISRRKRDDVSVNFKMEWKPDSLTTVTFRPNLTYSHTRSTGNGNSYTSNSLHQPVNSKYSTSLTESDNIGTNGNLQFFRKLNNKGRNFSLSARLQYSQNESDDYAFSRTFLYMADEEEIADRYSDKKNNGLTYRLQATYTEPISGKHSLQFKYTFQHRTSEAESYVYDREENDPYIDSLSSKVKNQYNTHQIETKLQGKYTKLNYNIGFSIDPQSSRSETAIGPNTGKNLEQTVTNFSPNLNIRYRFSKEKMIMVRYRGVSSAPEVEHLQEVIDISDPLYLQYGNPNLKPSFRNNVVLRYSNFVNNTQRNYSLNGTFSNTLNAVSRIITYDPETGGKESHIVNVNGNWNANAFFTFSTPFSNRKFTMSSSTNGGYADNVSYTNENREEPVKSTTHTWNLREKLTGSYRSDVFDVSLYTSVGYLLTQNSFRTSSNRETFDYQLGGNTNINLPWNMYLSTDITCRFYSGYAEGYNNSTIMWNAQVAKNFLKNNAATIRVKVYDILRQQNNVSRSISETMMSDTEYNTLGSYFMVHFVYRINTLGKSAGSSSNPNAGSRSQDRPQRGGGSGGESRYF